MMFFIYGVSPTFQKFCTLSEIKFPNVNCTPLVRHTLTRRCVFSMGKMSAEDKLAAVERYLNSKESSRVVAADFDISHRYLP